MQDMDESPPMPPLKLPPSGGEEIHSTGKNPGIAKKRLFFVFIAAVVVSIPLVAIIRAQIEASSKEGLVAGRHAPSFGTQRTNIVLVDPVRNFEACLGVSGEIVVAEPCNRPMAKQNWRFESGRALVGTRCLTYLASSNAIAAKPCVVTPEGPPNEQNISLVDGRIYFTKFSPEKVLFVSGSDVQSLSVVVLNSWTRAFDPSQQLRLRSPEFFTLETSDNYCLHYGGLNERVTFEECDQFGLNQTWLFEDDRLAAAGYSNLCLDLNTSTFAGELKVCDDSRNEQRFYLTSLGRIRSLANGRCMVNKLQTKIGTIAETKSAYDSNKHKSLFGVFREPDVTFLANSFTEKDGSDCDMFNSEQALIQNVSSQRLLLRITGSTGNTCLAHESFEQPGWSSRVKREICNKSDPQQLWSIGIHGANRFSSFGYCLDGFGFKPRVRPCGVLEDLAYQEVSFIAESLRFEKSRPRSVCLGFNRAKEGTYGSCGKSGTKFAIKATKRTPCSGTLPCMYGQGECLTDDTCLGSLVCGKRNCAPEFGLTGKTNCCTRRTPPPCNVSSASTFASALAGCPSGRIQVNVATLSLGSDSYRVPGAKSIEIFPVDGSTASIDLGSSNISVDGKLLIDGVQLRAGKSIMVTGATANLELEGVNHTDINSNQYVISNGGQVRFVASQLFTKQSDPIVKACRSSTGWKCTVELAQTEVSAPQRGSIVAEAAAVEMSGLQLNNFFKLFQDRTRVDELHWQETTRDYEWHETCLSHDTGVLIAADLDPSYDECLAACEAKQKRAGESCAGIKMTVDSTVASSTFNKASCWLYSRIDISRCSDTGATKKFSTDGWFIAAGSVSTQFTPVDLVPLSPASYSESTPTVQDCHALCTLYRDCGAVEYTSSGTCNLFSGLQVSSPPSTSTTMRLASSTAYSSVGNECRLDEFKILKSGILFPHLVREGSNACENACELVDRCVAVIVDVRFNTCTLLEQVPDNSAIRKGCGIDRMYGDLRVPTKTLMLQFPKFEGFELSTSAGICNTGASLGTCASLDLCKSLCAANDLCGVVVRSGSRYTMSRSSGLVPCGSPEALSIKLISAYFDEIAGDEREVMMQEVIGTTFEGCRYRCYYDENCTVFITSKEGLCKFETSSGSHNVKLLSGLSLRYYERRGARFGAFNDLSYFSYNQTAVFLSSMTGHDHIVRASAGVKSLEQCQFLCSSNSRCSFVRYTEETCQLFKSAYLQQSSTTAPVNSTYSFDAGVLLSGAVERDYVRTMYDCKPNALLRGSLSPVEESDAVDWCSRACEILQGCKGFTFEPLQEQCLFYEQVVDVAPCTIADDGVQVYIAQSSFYHSLNSVDGCLKGENFQTLTAISLEGCKQSCDAAWVAHRCGSFQYRYSDRTCVLHRGASFSQRGSSASGCLADYESFISTEKYEADSDGFVLVDYGCNGYGKYTGDVLKITEESAESCASTCRDNSLCLDTRVVSSKCHLLSSRAEFEQVRCARRCDLAAGCVAYNHVAGKCELITSLKLKDCPSDTSAYMRYATRHFRLVLESKCFQSDGIPAFPVESLGACSAICDAADGCVSFMYSSSTSSYALCRLSEQRKFTETCVSGSSSFELLSGGFAKVPRYCSGTILPLGGRDTARVTLDECRAFCDNQWHLCKGFTFDSKTQKCGLLSKLKLGSSCNKEVYVSYREHLLDKYKLRSVPNMKQPGSEAISTSHLPAATTLERCRDECYSNGACVTYSIANGVCTLRGGTAKPSLSSSNTYFKYSNERYAMLFGREMPKVPRKLLLKLVDTPIAECQAICTSDPQCAYVGLKCGAHGEKLQGEKRGDCELFGEGSPEPQFVVKTCANPKPGFKLSDLYGYERRIFSKQMHPSNVVVNKNILCSSQKSTLKKTRVVVDHVYELADGFNPARSCWSKCIELNCVGFEYYHYVFRENLRVLCNLFYVEWKDGVSRDASELQAVLATTKQGTCSTETSAASFRLRNFTRAKKLSGDTIATRVFFRSPSAKLARDAYRSTLNLQRMGNELRVKLEQSFDVAANLGSKFGYMADTASEVTDALGSQIANIDSIVGGLGHSKLALKAVPIVGGVVSKVINVVSKVVVKPMKKALTSLEKKLVKHSSVIEKVQSAASKLIGLMSNADIFTVILSRFISVVDILTSAYRCAFEVQDAALIESIESVLILITTSATRIQALFNIGSFLTDLRELEAAIVNPIVSTFKTFVSVLNGLASVLSNLGFLAEIANFNITIPAIPPFFPGDSLKLVHLLAPLRALSFVLWIFEKPLELLIHAILPKFSLPFLPALSDDFFSDIDRVTEKMLIMVENVIGELRKPFEQIEYMVQNITGQLPEVALPCELDFKSALTRRLQTTGKRSGQHVLRAEVGKRLGGAMCHDSPQKKKRKLNKKQQESAADARGRINPDRVWSLVQAVQLKPHQIDAFDYEVTSDKVDSMQLSLGMTLCAKALRTSIQSPTRKPTPTPAPTEKHYLVLTYDLTDESNSKVTGPECWFELDKNGQINGGTADGDSFEVDLNLQGNPWHGKKGDEVEEEDGSALVDYGNNKWEVELFAKVVKATSSSPLVPRVNSCPSSCPTTAKCNVDLSANRRRLAARASRGWEFLGQKKRPGRTRLFTAFKHNGNRRLFFNNSTFGACQFKTLVDPEFLEKISDEDNFEFLRIFKDEVVQVCKERSASTVTSAFRKFMNGETISSFRREGGAYPCSGQNLALSEFPNRVRCVLRNGDECKMNTCNNKRQTTWGPNRSPHLSTMYAVEHIYDKKLHKREGDQDADIITNSFANFVMANSGWNSGLGGIQNADFAKARRENRPNNAEQEKELVYRSDPNEAGQFNYFKAVEQLLLWCNGTIKEFSDIYRGLSDEGIKQAKLWRKRDDVEIPDESVRKQLTESSIKPFPLKWCP